MSEFMPQTNSATKSGTIRHFDCFIMGGGINGCGIARDAAGRGYSVCLCEAGDFGGGTSSASTKLVHGGLRYLEYYDFRLVREALMEREVLWKIAPHIIWPLRFVLPHHSGLRPYWLLRIGLFLYDHLGGRKLLPATSTLDLKQHPSGIPLKSIYSRALEYSDCWVEDSRLVILNARDAADRGAEILPKTSVVKAVSKNGQWQITTKNSLTGETENFTASTLVNATGPWVDEVLRTVLGQNDANNVRLVGGSHIVVKKIFEHDKCYIFQNSDNRIIFAIPYEGDYTLIGTTDVDYSEMAAKPEISDEEIDYLCNAASEYFSAPVSKADIVWTYSGIRPLMDDGADEAQEATRDYVIKVENSSGLAPLINIFGGKITTYRKLAEEVVGKLPNGKGTHHGSWTHSSALPGGDFEVDGFDQLVADIQNKYEFSPPGLAKRLVRHYGTKAHIVLEDAKKIGDLGTDFGCGLYQQEVDYLIENEWAIDASDILYRRTKLGIRMSKKQKKQLEAYMNNHVAEHISHKSQKRSS